jgi:hypothetical protein
MTNHRRKGKGNKELTFNNFQKKEKAVHWQDKGIQHSRQVHPHTNTILSVNQQHLHTTLLQNSFQETPPLFQPAPSPYTLQPLNPFYDAVPNNNLFFGRPQTFQQTKTLQQPSAFQQQPNWNTNLFQPPTNNLHQGRSTKENPFGPRHN